MNQMNRCLRGIIVLCGLAAGVLAMLQNPARAEAQEKKCYYCVCEVTCACVEVKCQTEVPAPD
jgi:hypothetical protein